MTCRGRCKYFKNLQRLTEEVQIFGVQRLFQKVVKKISALYVNAKDLIDPWRLQRPTERCRYLGNL